MATPEPSSHALTWEDLETFLALARAGSLAGGARRLGLNATTAGRRLQRLEARAGTRLFQRTPDGLLVTRAGEAIMPHAEEMERAAQRIGQRVRGEDDRAEGRVRLALTADFFAHYLARHLPELRRRHPRIVMEVLGSLARVDLARGEADLALRFADPSAGPPLASAGHVEILTQRLATMRVGLFAAPAYLRRRGRPRGLDALDGHDVIMPTEHARYLPGGQFLAALGDRVRPAIYLDSLPMIAAAAERGLGLCALPAFVGRRYRLERVAAPAVVAERHAWLLYPADLRRVTRVRLVRDFLVEVLRAAEELC